MKRFFLISLFLVMCSISLMAQSAGIELDPAIANAILNGGVLGFSVLTLTQLIKEKLNLAGGLVILVSLLVSLIATAFYFLTVAPPWTLSKEIGYGLIVFALANGWYLFKTQAIKSE
jgi:hypothetical protein